MSSTDNSRNKNGDAANIDVDTKSSPSIHRVASQTSRAVASTNWRSGSVTGNMPDNHPTRISDPGLMPYFQTRSPPGSRTGPYLTHSDEMAPSPTYANALASMPPTPTTMFGPIGSPVNRGDAGPVGYPVPVYQAGARHGAVPSDAHSVDMTPNYGNISNGAMMANSEENMLPSRLLGSIPGEPVYDYQADHLGADYRLTAFPMPTNVSSGGSGYGAAVPSVLRNQVAPFAARGGIPSNDLRVIGAYSPLNYAYCIQRPNGMLVPLIPVDVLPALRDVPAFTSDAQDVTILPTPAGRAPSGRSYYMEPIEVCSNDSHIDRVVARAVPSNAQAAARRRREKIYCDKWIHDGTCAFTQQGCKFKHEMPMDRETQRELGLFHGLPTWWKRQQADIQRQQTEGQHQHVLQITEGEAMSHSAEGMSLVPQDGASTGLAPWTGSFPLGHSGNDHLDAHAVAALAMSHHPSAMPQYRGENDSYASRVVEMSDGSAASFGPIGSRRRNSRANNVPGSTSHAHGPVVRRGLGDYNPYSSLSTEAEGMEDGDHESDEN